MAGNVPNTAFRPQGIHGARPVFAKRPARAVRFLRRFCHCPEGLRGSLPGLRQVLHIRRLALLLAGVLTLVQLVLPVDATAALRRQDATSLQDAFNPAPDFGDIALPMPGGLTMVFRLAAVPANGHLLSMTLDLGVTDLAEPGRAFYDSSRESLLAAPFEVWDLPDEWLPFLPKEPEKYRYYLVAKYEVTRMQWRAVMARAEASDFVGTEDCLPVTGISWYDAQEFTRRYTRYLLKNHPELLPSFAEDERNAAFVRLPTEAEWEYAARGGHRDDADYRQRDFFTLAPGKELSDYAAFRDAASSHGVERLERVGRRLPNPLGLHDTAGNAAEMTIDLFRFSTAGQLQGSAGGFVRKGGSYLSTREEIMPGRREEAAPFLRDGELSVGDLGFRPVISGINTPGGSRPALLEREYAALSRQHPAMDDAGEEPASAENTEDASLKVLDRLILRERSERTKASLRAVRAKIEENNVLRARERMTRAEGRVQECLMHLDAVRNYRFRRFVLEEALQSARLEFEDKALSPEIRLRYERVNESRERSVKDIDETIGRLLLAYRSELSQLMLLEEEVFANALRSVQGRYAGSDSYSRRMRIHLSLIEANNASMRKGEQIPDADLIEAIENGPKRSDAQGKADQENSRDKGKADQESGQEQGKADQESRQDKGRNGQESPQEQGKADRDSGQEQGKTDWESSQEQDKADQESGQGQNQDKSDQESSQEQENAPDQSR